jgi:Uri superfamily endonuclease
MKSLDELKEECINNIVAYSRIKKVIDAQRGLRWHINKINNRLNYPKLPVIEREALNTELAEANKLLDHSKKSVSGGLK